jgi:hypothetical protein
MFRTSKHSGPSTIPHKQFTNMLRSTAVARGTTEDPVSPSGMRKSSSSRVSFSDANKTIVVDSPPPELQNASWYSPDEIRVFKKSTNVPDSSSQRRDFILSLLEIQREHKELGIDDPKGLRQISKVASRESLKRAIARASGHTT